MMAHAELAKTEGANRVFAAFDYVERFASHRTAVLDAGREACRSWLVPYAQPGLARQFANFSLGEPRLKQRSGNTVLFCSLLSGTEVSLVVNVHAVGNYVEAASYAQFLHHGEKLVFTLKAALAVIAGIFGAVEFGGGNDFERNRLLVGKGDGIVQVRASEAGRIGDYRQHVCAQCAMSDPSEIGGVDAT